MAVGAKDMTVRIYALEKFKNFSVCSLGGMIDPVVGVFFEADSLDCYTVSSGGQLAVWESSLDLAQLEPGELVRKKKRRPKSVDVESDEDVSPPLEAMDKAAGAEVLEATDKANESTRLIYKRSARHFLR